MRTRLALTTGIFSLSLFMLAACTPGSGGSDGTGGPGDTGGAGGGLAECLEGVWDLDTADLAAQLQATFVSNGSPITTSVAEGGATLTVAGDEMTYDSDVTYTMSGDSDGLEMVVAQSHKGVSNGQWAESDGDLVFSDWENAITITNTTTIGGVAGEPTVIPGGIDNSVVMAVTCEGDTLTTQPDVSPYVSTWTRVG